MFLSKLRGQKPEAPRSELEGIAVTHSGTGQKILAVMVAIAASFVILGGITIKYIFPINGDKKPAALTSDTKAGEAKPQTPQINVPLDLDQSRDTPAAANPDYQPMPGLAGDARPSPAPQAGRVPAPDRSLPPGMQTSDSAPRAATPDQDRIAERKLTGDLGDFGDAPAERTRAPERSAGRVDQDSCAGIQGGAEAVAECNRRVSVRTPPPAAPMPAPAPAPGPQNGSNLSSQLVAISTPNGGVGQVPHPHLTLRKGDPITCTLETAIQSDQAGFVECVTDYPIYSMDGKTILAERGTRIHGEYSRDVAPGSRSIFVLWTRGETPAPHHVTFDLLSPGSDRLGRSGIAGEVDNKYWERYSGPLMFSVLQDASAIALTKAAGTPSGSAVFLLPNTQGAGQSAVAELLKQGSDVKRSLYRNQGDTISITVARYIDFSPIYTLKPVKGAR